jgi:hypothetical protein
MVGQQFTEISTQNKSQPKASLEWAYKNYRLPVCFFTASEDVDYDEYKNLLSLSVEEKCFIKKPIDMHQLLWLIHRILG